MKVPFDEQETNVTIDYADRAAYVYSSMPKEASRLRRMAADYASETEVVLDNDFGIEIKMPIKWVKIKPPARRPDVTTRWERNKT